MNVEARIACEHRAEVRARLVVEDMDRDSICFGISEFIADSKGRRSTFSNQHVGFPQPGGILLIDSDVTVFQTFRFAFRKVADMFCQNDMAALEDLDCVLPTEDETDPGGQEAGAETAVEPGDE